MAPLQLFPTDPALSYPHFSTYRLNSHEPSPSDQLVGPSSCPYSSSSFSLTLPHPPPYKTTASRFKHGQDPLGYKEVKARIGWDHLATGAHENEVIYIDADYRLISCSIPIHSPQAENQQLQKIAEPEYRVLAELPIPLNAESPEYPSALHLGGGIYLASAGTGTLHVIDSVRSPTNYSFDILLQEDERGSSRPFLLHACHENQVIISRTVRTHESKSKYKTSFQVACIQVDGLGTEGTPSWACLWNLHGEEFPSYVHWEAGRWIIGGPAVFRDANEASDGRKSGSGSQALENPRMAETSNQTPDYPYAWSQTPSTVTVTFRLPKSFSPSRDIVCVIRAHDVDIQLFERGGALTSAQTEFLKTSTRDWWDTVVKDESTWTWDKNDGLLTIHLEKANPGNTWNQVFSPQEDRPLDVPQSFTEEQLEAARAGLDKFTQEIDDIEKAGRQAQSTLPGLLHEEIEDEGFERSVKELLFTYVPGGPQDKAVAATLLSKGFDGSIIIKGNVDGMLYRPPPKAEATAWKQIATSPALSFVLASKRDVVFAYHLVEASTQRPLVMAFENRLQAGGNIYVYWPVEGDVQTRLGRGAAEYARQGVVTFGGQASVDIGTIMGVKPIKVDGQTLVVALVEGALVLVYGLL